MNVPKGRKVYANGKTYKAGADLPKQLEKVIEKPAKRGRPPKAEPESVVEEEA